MNRYMLLHYGFEKPAPEVMAAWHDWFASIADITEDQGAHFAHGTEITRDGQSALPLGPDSITGYTIIRAESLAAAGEIAARNPFIKAIRVYEMK